MKFKIESPNKKPEKKACNYYLKVDTIKDLHDKALKYNMKDSQLLENIIEQALKQI